MTLPILWSYAGDFTSGSIYGFVLTCWIVVAYDYSDFMCHLAIAYMHLASGAKKGSRTETLAEFDKAFGRQISENKIVPIHSKC